MYRTLALVGALLLLAACAKPREVVKYQYTTISCPVVRHCKLPTTEYKTNGDLVMGIVELREEVEYCATAIDTLTMCIGAHNERMSALSQDKK